MESFVDFITRLIYGTGVEAVITPNHNDWLSANPSPSGLDWIDHYLDQMLPAYENWISSNNLPPITPWNGEDTETWVAGDEYPIAGEPLDNPNAIASLDALGDAFYDRYLLVAAVGGSISARLEIADVEKDPFSYRFWGFLKFADLIRRRYVGEIVITPTIVYDRDGTILSPVPFCDTYNNLHANWHGSNSPSSQNSQPTPGFESSAGQTTSLGGIGMGSGEEFIKFHHDHVELFSRWLARTGQLPVKPINMYNGNTGWPGSNTGNPSTWTENLESTWINTSTGDSDGELQALADVDALGSLMNGGIHGPGHTRNSDITDINHNNYVPRFHAWHGWIDAQWYFRKPRFGYYDNAAEQRQKIFNPVDFSTGNDWPGMKALTIVRDPNATEDTIAPANSVNGIDFSTGAGSLRLKFRVEDPYNRQLNMRLKAEVFDDATNTIVETIPEASHTYVVGATASGDDFDRDTDFTVDFDFASAFQSDDPTRANPAVGFVANRIRITGTLEVADGSDPGFVETDFIDIDLIKEKSAPEMDLYFDLSSFGEDQVQSALTASGTGEAVFANALYVTLQDQTTKANPIDWLANPDVSPVVHGLVAGLTPASGLFDDPAHAPTIVLGNVGAGAISGVRIELASGPSLEDPALPNNLPQRFTYAYNVIFESANNAFDGLAVGAQQFVSLNVSAYDRSGNQVNETGQLKLFRAANPYMVDGSTSWLSIDTRVFHVLEGDTLFGENITGSTNPNTFIQTVLNKLDTNTGLGGDSFDSLPTNQAQSALLPFDTVTDQSTGTSKVVHNFAIAKVRLQGNNGASNVRAFFRLFRYSASNLVFDPSNHYRTHDAGGGVKIALLGFADEVAGAELLSIPFFAEPRVAFGSAMTGQTDAPNAKNFPGGNNNEQVLYFGAYLDINNSGVRFPLEYIAAHPDGGFNGGDPTQSLPTLMLDHHQCMVVEINYDDDETTVGDTPANSDNLAQRNLMILTTDNPGAPITHTVQHSFEMDLGKVVPRHDDKFIANVIHARETAAAKLTRPTIKKLGFVDQGRWDRLVRDKAINEAMNTPRVMMSEWQQFVPKFESEANNQSNLVMRGDRWQSTSRFIDELMINWGELPNTAQAKLFLPGINCEHIINLRNLRHAPGNVKIIDSQTLQLQIGPTTYLPLPPLRTDKLTGVLTIVLPSGIKKGQDWQVDVLQIRGRERRVLGGIQVDIQVKDAKEIYAQETRLLQYVFDQYSLLEPSHRWYPVLKYRVDTLRARAKALAESAGVEWKDPTSYANPKNPDETLPYRGKKIRVVLEKVQILDDLDTFFKGRGEIAFASQVYTENNGGVLQKHKLPEKGVFKVSDRPGENMVQLNCPIFEGYVEDDLRIAIVGMEKDLFDPNDILGKYTRHFHGTIARHFGVYGPDDELLDPEDMESWKIWYRIERA